MVIDKNDVLRVFCSIIAVICVFVGKGKKGQKKGKERKCVGLAERVKE